MQTTAASGGADNLGDHIAAQNLEMNGNWISSDGDNEGVFVDASGNVGIGTDIPNEQLEITGNLRLAATTADSGIIKIDANRFLHNFNGDLFAGENAGNFAMTGLGNTGLGTEALSNTGTGQTNTGVGSLALRDNTSGSSNTAVGFQSLIGNTTAFSNTAVGSQSLQTNSTGDDNTAVGSLSLFANTTGFQNAALGSSALQNNTTGSNNTAIGDFTLGTNVAGSNNTAIGSGADVIADNLTNATAIGHGAVVDDNNKIRLGNAEVTVIEGEVDFTFSSDSTKKENFRHADGEAVLEKLRSFRLGSWNYKGHNPFTQRHYGPMAQDFFNAFGRDGIGIIGNDTTLTGSDVSGINMIAIQALEKRTQEFNDQSEEVARLQTMVKLQAEELSSTQDVIKSQANELATAKAELKQLKAQMARFTSLLEKLEAAEVKAASFNGDE